MSKLTEFKRLNFFTGFFTTAKDWTDGQLYHLEKRKLHNRGLHTPGVMRGVGNDLGVVAARGLQIQVRPGAALDGEGRELYLGQSKILTIESESFSLPQTAYVAISYREQESDQVENVEAPQYSGFTRVTENPRLEVTENRPDNRNTLELARIHLQSGVTEVSAADDSDNPVGNEIDRRFVVYAGSVGVAEKMMTPRDLQQLLLTMSNTRKNFAALSIPFPVISATDVRQGAITLEMLGRAGGLHPEQVPDLLTALADVEQDVEQELAKAYTFLVNTDEFQTYQQALSKLLASLREGVTDVGILFTEQGKVALRAEELAQIVLEKPVAGAIPPPTITATGNEVVVTLDASNSKAFGDREIKRYIWRKIT